MPTIKLRGMPHQRTAARVAIGDTESAKEAVRLSLVTIRRGITPDGGYTGMANIVNDIVVNLMHKDIWSSRAKNFLRTADVGVSFASQFSPPNVSADSEVDFRHTWQLQVPVIDYTNFVFPGLVVEMPTNTRLNVVVGDTFDRLLYGNGNHWARLEVDPARLYAMIHHDHFGEVPISNYSEARRLFDRAAGAFGEDVYWPVADRVHAYVRRLAVAVRERQRWYDFEQEVYKIVKPFGVAPRWAEYAAYLPHLKQVFRDRAMSDSYRAAAMEEWAGRGEVRPLSLFLGDGPTDAFDEMNQRWAGHLLKQQLQAR